MNIAFRTAALIVSGCMLSMTGVGASAQIIKLGPPIKFPLPSPDDFVSITAGAHHTCATRVNGNTYCWGLNNTGQVGVGGSRICTGVACVDRPQFVMNAKQVDAGIDHTCALDAAGAAHCWGNSNYGQLGNGNYGYLSQPIPVSGNLTFTSISAGQFSTCGTTSGGMYCWGAIMNGLSGTPTPQLVFAWNGYQSVNVGYLSACALYVVGGWREADCWGNNQYGQAGVDPAQLPIAPPTVRSTFDVSVTRLAVQSYHTCADQATGVVQCFGYNGYGQLGNGSFATTYVAQNVGGGMPLHGVSTGSNHGCALDTANRAYCWGNGYWGQLGNGVSAVFASPQAVAGGRSYRAIAAGQQHACAIGTDNHIYCWGSNHYGQLGTQYPGGWVSTPVQTLDPA
ncbi:MAG TPA: hypothetical protein VGP22_09395 [Albitalea sp.]|jgi:alpha-tubulin suppressor-like RCC1 family protein|nr:hypothetical protein [Albitalea sp.]